MKAPAFSAPGEAFALNFYNYKTDDGESEKDMDMSLPSFPATPVSSPGEALKSNFYNIKHWLRNLQFYILTVMKSH